MEVFPKIQTLFKRDLDGSITGQKGKMILGEWTTSELEYLANNEWEFTEKVDGTNIRIRWPNSGMRPEIGGRTSAAIIPVDLLSYLEKTFTHELFRKAWPLSDNRPDFDVILFGEGYGPKIQGGGKYSEYASFVLFDVKIGNYWLKREDVDDIAKKMGIESVPVIGYGSLWKAIEMVSGYEYESLNGMTHSAPTLRSKWGNFEAEGIVARPKVALFDRRGNRIITKIKCVDFR